MILQNNKSNKEDPATKTMSQDFPFNSNTNKADSQDSPKPAIAANTTGHLPQIDSTLPLIKQLTRKTSRNKVINNNNLGRKKPSNTSTNTNDSLMAAKVASIVKQADIKSVLLKALQTAVGSRAPGAALKGVAGVAGKGIANYGVPLAAGGYTAYKANEAGMSPFSSGMLGLAAGSVASPKMYMNAAKAGLRSPEGPIPGFLNHMKGPIANKALLTGLAIAPEGIRNINNTLNNTQTVSKNLADSTANMAGTSNELQNSLKSTAGNVDRLTGKLDTVINSGNAAQDAGKGFFEGGLGAIGDSLKSTVKNPYVWGTAAGLGGLYGGYKILDKYLQYKAKSDKIKAMATMPPKPPKPNVVNLDDVLARLNRAQHSGVEVPQ